MFFLLTLKCNIKFWLFHFVIRMCLSSEKTTRFRGFQNTSWFDQREKCVCVLLCPWPQRLNHCPSLLHWYGKTLVTAKQHFTILVFVYYILGMENIPQLWLLKPLWWQAWCEQINQQHHSTASVQPVRDSWPQSKATLTRFSNWKRHLKE